MPSKKNLPLVSRYKGQGVNLCKAHNVFKPSLPSPNGYLVDSTSPASIKDMNEAIKDVSSNRAHDCECSFSGESLGICSSI